MPKPRYVLTSLIPVVFRRIVHVVSFIAVSRHVSQPMPPIRRPDAVFDRRHTAPHLGRDRAFAVPIIRERIAHDIVFS